ncbi:oligosaccharide flippase family protein [Tenacibaculum sp. UWU-22]|uniref:oligosaccharide flippase family protein n=1 Tax=Tenacibaculum sp. UWU-22 TaxID=3234187 RepID=UPI0034DAF8AA
MKFSVFVNNFIKRKGILVGVSSMVEKIGGFCVVFIATHFLTQNNFGLITYANTILMFIAPFIGFGIHQGLIRYGSIAKSQIEKKNLFIFTLKKGIKFSFVLIGIVILLSPLLTSNLKQANTYLIILSFQLLSLFLYEMLRVYSRIINLNKLYAYITIFKTLLLVISTYLLTLKFKNIGYVIAITLTPFLTAIFYFKKIKLKTFKSTTLSKIQFKNILFYGFNTSVGGVLSQLLYAVDILLIANIIKKEAAVALYKVSSVVPFSLLILPLIFMKTDFVLLANKSVVDKQYIKKYYFNYLKIFTVISFLIVLFFYFFSGSIMSLFSESYTDSSLVIIFAVGVVGALLLRIPLGNILSAVGLTKINAINSFIIVLLNIVLGYIFILKYGLVGAALTTAFLMWFSGVLSLLFFIRFLKQ